MKKIGNNKGNQVKIFITLMGLLIATTGLAQNVPNQFTAGTPAVASEVNANFASVDGRIAQINTDGQTIVSVVEQLFAEITTQSSPIGSGTVVASSTCPINTIPISANCACTGDGVAANFGFIEACVVLPDGAVGVCNIEFTFDPNLPFPTLDVFAMCLGATLVNGSPAFVTTTPLQEQQRAESALIVEEISAKSWAHLNSTLRFQRR